MSSDDSGPRLAQARGYISYADNLGGFAEAFVAGAGGLVTAFFAIIIGVGEAFANLIISPTDAFARLSVTSLDAIFGAPARFMRDAWNTAAVALGQDPWMSLGPFVAFVAMLSAILTIGIAIFALDQADFDTPTGLNLPFVEIDTGGTLDDEND